MNGNNYETLINTGTAGKDTAYLHGDLTSVIIAAFYAVFNRLGFGFLESVYRNALRNELRRRNIPCELEVAIDVFDMGEPVGHYRADLLVDGRVLVEVKATQSTGEPDRKQLLNYLRATRVEVGLLLHFGPKPSVQRLLFTNDLKPTTAH